MSYTDKFFEFPVRVMDGFELRKNMEIEERALDNDPVIAQPSKLDYVIGRQLILPDDIIGLSAIFSREKSLDDVRENGFDLTLIETDRLGEIVSTWPLAKFKAKLNAFMEERKIQLEKERENSASTTPTIVYLIGNGGNKEQQL